MHSGQSIYLHTVDPDQATQLDTLLWTYSQGSFVPHEIWQGERQDGNESAPVLIGSHEPPEDHHEVLINLASEVPGFFSRYERVLEVVDPKNPEPGRQRYQYYKDRGYPLDLHKIGH